MMGWMAPLRHLSANLMHRNPANDPTPPQSKSNRKSYPNSIGISLTPILAFSRHSPTLVRSLTLAKT